MILKLSSEDVLDKCENYVTGHRLLGLAIEFEEEERRLVSLIALGNTIGDNAYEISKGNLIELKRQFIMLVKYSGFSVE